MTPGIAYEVVVTPTMLYLGEPYDSSDARLLLVAIGCQESAFKTRRQLHGPARGFWQFEKRGGCDEFARLASIKPFRDAARELAFKTDAESTYVALAEGADVLACLMARAILWPNPRPLPARGEIDAAFTYYEQVWRPGKPSRARWTSSYATACEIVPP